MKNQMTFTYVFLEIVKFTSIFYLAFVTIALERKRT